MRRRLTLPTVLSVVAVAALVGVACGDITPSPSPDGALPIPSPDGPLSDGSADALESLDAPGLPDAPADTVVPLDSPVDTPA